MGIDEHNTPCIEWRWWNEMSHDLLANAHGIKQDFDIDQDLAAARTDIIAEREDDGMDPADAQAEPIPTKQLFHDAFWAADEAHNHSYNNMELIVRSAFYDECENALGSKKDLLLQFSKVCSNAGLDKNAVYKALDDALTEIYGHEKPEAAEYLRNDVYSLIEPVLSAKQNVELTNGNDAAEIQLQVSEHPKECFQAALKDVAEQYTAASIAKDMSVEAMDFHLSTELQAHQEALYEAALEQGLSHDDLEYAFGDNFVAEMENREQMQQTEKNNEDPNLE